MSTDREPDARHNDEASVMEPPKTGDASVDAILTDFRSQSGGSGDLRARIEAATSAHRQLQARLSADRER